MSSGGEANPGTEAAATGGDRLATVDELALALGTASQFAEEISRRWLSEVFKRPIGEGNGYIGHIKFTPKLDDAEATAPSFTLQLDVVPADYTLNLADVPADALDDVKFNVARLLQAARLYVRVLVDQHLPEHSPWIERALVPSTFGTIYLLGTPPDVRHIGVVMRPA